MTARDRGPDTALIAEIPAAEPVIGRHRALLDANAALGVPAHITVLAPFVPFSRLAEGELTLLRDLFATVSAFDVRLDRTDWFGTSVLWLGPQDPAPFRDLTARVFGAFPEFPPYGGQFDDVVPHLTVGGACPKDEMHRAEAMIAGQLPIIDRVSAVTLIAESSPGGQWQTLASFPLRG